MRLSRKESKRGKRETVPKAHTVHWVLQSAAAADGDEDREEDDDDDTETTTNDKRKT